jgi:hypothetical protein
MEERRLRVLKHNVLRTVSLPIRVEIAGDWRILHSEELHNLISADCGWSNRGA